MEAKKIRNFDDLKTMGAVSKDFQIGARKITLRSLGYEEQSLLVSSVPDVDTNGKKLAESRRLDIIQRELLAAAIVAIDGEAVTLEETKDLLAAAQTPLVNLLFDLYEQLIASQAAIMDDVKKNISSLKTP